MLTVMEIKTRRAAAVFDNLRQRRILLALIERERSLSELAELTQLRLNLLHHHINRFLELGLIRIERHQRRAGTPIKFYRAAAQAYFVPAELTRARPNAALQHRLQTALEREMAKVYKGIIYSHDGNGPRMRLVSEGRPGAVAVEFWLELRLSKTEAQGFVDELKALITKYQAQSRGNNYVFHAGIARS